MNDTGPTERTDSSGAAAFSFEATGLGASLTVGDLPASVRWYTDVLGFAVEREFERDGVRFAVRLRAGSVALLLTRDNGSRGATRAKGEGFSLRLTTAQDIDEMATRIEERGTKLESEPADAWGVRAFRVRDPDGFLFVIST
jgi:catechol 2,3-dioxygenase-like lactoylglutathione lyase family enzyme